MFLAPYQMDSLPCRCGITQRARRYIRPIRRKDMNRYPPYIKGKSRRIPRMHDLCCALRTLERQNDEKQGLSPPRQKKKGAKKASWLCPMPPFPKVPFTEERDAFLIVSSLKRWVEKLCGDISEFESASEALRDFGTRLTFSRETYTGEDLLFIPLI